MEVMDNTALSSQTEQAPMSKDSATRLTTDSPAAVLLQPGHHHVVQLQRSGSYGSGSPKSSEASEESSEDDDDASSTEESEDDDHGSDEEIIEAEEYEEGGWSDEEDEETRKVRELKKKLHGSDVLFKAPKLSLRDGGANATAAPSPAKKSALPRHLQTLHFRREKSNSTSSLYVNSTISAPNLDQVLWWYVHRADSTRSYLPTRLSSSASRFCFSPRSTQYGDGDLVPLHRRPRRHPRFVRNL
ncbi:uncharacterized protein ACA1_198130 [Acanthamoeba castellanii str. Neff]|uniref:Uncharacterized protein n=1 Tax=Acanthamoeba castellanii (strain ATCC 30010 / Neff) TaxID=1257118 RepID=L8H4G9_ACACF|nr:uncharacterized protein ACA1_198130 [Acanthamoeba castellanii str. Neff]ELR19603.1 hypothetical protein ACA1_198130 [Acanthamoeba castellanii str. Neff]